VTGLRDRGLDAERGVLVVFDGGNVLAAAVRGVFSTNARIQRCRRTRNDNVLDHLPEAERPLVQRRLRIKGYQELPALAAALERAAANEALLDLVLTA
jgi:transposase-like protein